ncbi:MAG TPA: alpha/beta hydrolase [Patescibacteria group bacterium]|nr:alpha/beta hydrolase [Patescibacteria group bacterium]
MARGRTIFIIPGFRQNPKSTTYKRVARLFEKEGFRVVSIEIRWKNKTISQTVEDFIEVYKSFKYEEKYILGFSYGAMIAFIAGTKIKSDGLILCSLSPFFSEDLKTNKSRSIIMKKRYTDFAKLRADLLSKKLKTKKVLMLYGTQEATSLIKRVKNTFENIDTEKTLIKIKSDHEIGSTRYINTIQKISTSFNKYLTA